MGPCWRKAEEMPNLTLLRRMTDKEHLFINTLRFLGSPEKHIDIPIIWTYFAYLCIIMYTCCTLWKRYSTHPFWARSYNQVPCAVASPRLVSRLCGEGWKETGRYGLGHWCGHAWYFEHSNCANSLQFQPSNLGGLILWTRPGCRMGNLKRHFAEYFRFL